MLNGRLHGTIEGWRKKKVETSNATCSLPSLPPSNDLITRLLKRSSYRGLDDISRGMKKRETCNECWYYSFLVWTRRTGRTATILKMIINQRVTDRFTTNATSPLVWLIINIILIIIIIIITTPTITIFIAITTMLSTLNRLDNKFCIFVKTCLLKSNHDNKRNWKGYAYSISL